MSTHDILEQSFSYCRMAMEDHNDIIHAELLKLVGTDKDLSREGLLDMLGFGLKKVNELSIKEFTDSVNSNLSDIQNIREKINKHINNIAGLKKDLVSDDPEADYPYFQFLGIFESASPVITGKKYNAKENITLELMRRILSEHLLDIKCKDTDIFIKSPLDKYMKNISDWAYHSYDDDDEYMGIIKDASSCISLSPYYYLIFGNDSSSGVNITGTFILDVNASEFIIYGGDGTYDQKFLKFIVDNEKNYTGDNLKKLIAEYNNLLDNYISICKTLHTFINNNANLLKNKYNSISEAIKNKDKDVYTQAVEEYKQISKKVKLASELGSMLKNTARSLSHMFDIYVKS